MRTTLNLDDKLIKKAQKMTKIKQKTSLIHKALELLIAHAAQFELSNFSGTQKKIKFIKRD
jgi:Arc/MetJ family transcription regulator